MARRVLSDRKKGRGPSGVVWMEPITDEAYQALLAHRALLERGFSHDE
ncbi:MAG TPA: hypothetical protein VG758_24860 [Hyphomicrobiaceae bacterium]|jgi:hypothetical protein|nr:hypothetical protein [Hyphomicrobiaceae bacterium]